MNINVLFFVGCFTFLTFGTEGQEEGKRTSILCNDLCVQLAERFKANGIFSAKQAEYEMRKICEEKLATSQLMCEMFPENASKIAVLVKDSEEKKICRHVCFREPKLINESKTNRGEQRCWNCKQKVKMAARIANLVKVSLTRMVDIICPQLPSKDFRSEVVCKAVTRNIASTNTGVQYAANRICSALHYCVPIEIPSDECILSNATRKGKGFEIALRVVQLITSSIQAFTSKEPHGFAVDETAKCLPYRSKTAARSPRKSRRITSCQKLCKNITEIVEQNKNFNAGSFFVQREQFKEFCYSFQEGRAKSRCLVIYEAMDKTAILETIFQKEICEQLSCDSFQMYPEWHCTLCEFNVLQRSIKVRIENALRTMTDITEGVRALCKMKTDPKCEDFLATQYKFQQEMQNAVQDNNVCNFMGFCKA